MGRQTGTAGYITSGLQLGRAEVLRGLELPEHGQARASQH